MKVKNLFLLKTLFFLLILSKAVADPLNVVVATIPVGDSPGTPIASGGFLYVPNDDSNSVSVIDVDDFNVVATITVGMNPTTPVALASFVYVPNQLSDSVTVIDVDNFKVVATITVGGSPATPVASAGFLYVPNGGSDRISVIDLRQVPEEITVFGKTFTLTP